MDDVGINENIVKKIEQITQEDEVLRQFLMDIISIEINSPGWWKEPYKEKIKKHAACWRDPDEN